MSSSDSFRPDPFSNPFAPTDRGAIPTASLAPTKKSSSRRPLFLFFALAMTVMVGSAIFFAPTLRALWRLSDARGKVADRQDEEAVRQLDAAIEASPKEVELRVERLRIVSRLGEMEKAKEDLEAIEKYLGDQAQPLPRRLLELRSQFRQMAGAYRKALEDQTAVVAEVKDAEATPVEEALYLNNHAYSAGLAVEKEPKEESADRELLKAALADCDRALKLAPDQGSTLDTRGYIHYLLGDNERALADLDRAVELVSKDVKQAQAEVNGDERQLSKKLGLREIEHSAAVMYQHRMKVQQKAGNEEAAKKDRQAIIDLGYKPDVFLQ